MADTHDPNCAIVRLGDIRAWCDCGRGSEMADNDKALVKRLRETLLDVLVYCPDYMHGMPKKHYVKIALGKSK